MLSSRRSVPHGPTKRNMPVVLCVNGDSAPLRLLSAAKVGIVRADGVADGFDNQLAVGHKVVEALVLEGPDVREAVAEDLGHGALAPGVEVVHCDCASRGAGVRRHDQVARDALVAADAAADLVHLASKIVQGVPAALCGPASAAAVSVTCPGECVSPIGGGQEMIAPSAVEPSH